MSEKSTKSTDEQSHKEVAAKVITEKRKYFFPVEGKTVEANSLDEATNLVKKEVKDDKEQK